MLVLIAINEENERVINMASVTEVRKCCKRNDKVIFNFTDDTSLTVSVENASETLGQIYSNPVEKTKIRATSVE